MKKLKELSLTEAKEKLEQLKKSKSWSSGLVKQALAKLIVQLQKGKQ